MSHTALRSNRALVVAIIMLATFMVAIEATIVATAMPKIVGQLGGFTYYSWVSRLFFWHNRRQPSFTASFRTSSGANRF